MLFFCTEKKNTTRCKNVPKMDASYYPAQETTPKGENSLPVEEQETLIKDTFRLLKSGETEIQLSQQIKDVVVVLGDTGNGKSVLTQWITGDATQLLAKETEEGSGEYIIEDINASDRGIITSVTTYPQMILDEDTNVAFCDTPGFNDTRDSSNEIAATYFIKKVLDHAERVKLIFVINYPSVRRGVDRHNFMKLVKHISDFVKNIDKFQNSIALIVTKVDNIYVKHGNDRILVNDSKVIETIANFLTKVKEELEVQLQNDLSKVRQLHEEAVKFIEVLLIRDGDQYARIGIFRRPDEAGTLNKTSLLQAEKKAIRRLIHEKLRFCDKENEDFGYTISDKCKNSIYYLVEDINESVWISLGQIKEEFKKYFSNIINTLRSIVQSFSDEAACSADLHKVQQMSVGLGDKIGSILSLVKDIESVTNPEDLVQKIDAFISNLNIDISRNDLLVIEEKGRYFNFLQVVNDRMLSIRPWHEIFREVVEYLFTAKEKLQEDIYSTASVICKQIESDLQKIAKTWQDQIDGKIKLLAIEETNKVLSNYHEIIVKMIEKAEAFKSLRELLSNACEVTREMGINLPEDIVQNVLEHEKKIIFLKDISEKEFYFSLSFWIHPFQSVVKHLVKSKIWYTFLNGLYRKFSEYEVQKNREEYNVINIEDWGKTSKPQGIFITESNFEQFLSNIAEYGIAEYDNIKSIALTELRLNELNQLLNITLKSRLDIQCTQTSISIKGDYVRIDEVATHLYNDCNLSDALKSGKYKSLHIFALQKVFIDGDLDLPGCELTIISPKWVIMGTRKINLDGVDGEAYFETKAKDGLFRINGKSNGKNGKPGLPGKPGGIFLGIGGSFFNGAGLTVTVNGGTGSPGQRGGNGAQGENGKSIGKLTNEDLPCTDTHTIKGFRFKEIRKWSSPGLFLSLIRLFKSMEENTFYQIDGTPGQVGGRGGDGGKGGYGGNPGTVLMFDLSKDTSITIQASKGRDGIDGRGGEGGKGGMNGRTTYAVLNGLWMKEWVQQVKSEAEYASDGEDGSPGRNREGIIIPEPAKPAFEPFTIINDYKMYAEENSTSCFKKSLLLNFISMLNNSEDINTLSVVDT